MPSICEEKYPFNTNRFFASTKQQQKSIHLWQQELESFEQNYNDYEQTLADLKRKVKNNAWNSSTEIQRMIQHYENSSANYDSLYHQLFTLNQKHTALIQKIFGNSNLQFDTVQKKDYDQMQEYLHSKDLINKGGRWFKGISEDKFVKIQNLFFILKVYIQALIYLTGKEIHDLCNKQYDLLRKSMQVFNYQEQDEPNTRHMSTKYKLVFD